MVRTVTSLAVVTVLFTLLPADTTRGQGFKAVHGVDSAGYQKWLDRVTKDGYRPVYVDGYDAGGAAAYAAVAVKDANPPVWEGRHGLTAEEYQKAFDGLVGKGYRPISVGGYLDAGVPHFAAVFVKDHSQSAWNAGHNLTPTEYQEKVKALAKKGLRPDMVTGYADGRGGYRFTALFVEAGNTPWEAKHDLSPEAYQKLVSEMSAKGFRPVSATAYQTPNGLRFAVVFIKDNAVWEARHDLIPEEYQAEFDKKVKAGYRPIIVAGYPTGTPTGAKAFETAMEQFMSDRSIPAGTLSVSKDGKVLVSRGYGFADTGKTRTVRSDDPFRLASVVKPITRAAIRKLVAKGQLRLDTKVFPFLGLKPLPGQSPDTRLNSITVQHLLDHRGGWDRDAAFDPMFRPLEIAKAVGKPGPAGPVDIIRYMMGQPLQFDPGSKEVYSNFGYCVLGRVIEKVTGKTYVRYVRDEVLAPLRITSIDLGRSLPGERNRREPVYVDPGKGKNVIQPESTVAVPAPDGTFYLEAMDAHGGLIGSAPDLIRFLDAYWISGEPRVGNGQDWTFFGSLPGTWTMVMQRPNGVNVAALFNQRTDPSGRDYSKIQPLLQAAADGLTSGGLRYLAVFVKD